VRASASYEGAPVKDAVEVGNGDLAPGCGGVYEAAAAEVKADVRDLAFDPEEQ
jgi:hypothetical protein